MISERVWTAEDEALYQEQVTAEAEGAERTRIGNTPTCEVTDELFASIRDEILKRNNGLDVTMEGGGSGAVFLAVKLNDAAQEGEAKDTRVAVYANQNETWQADVYESLDAVYNGENALNSEDYATSINSDVTDAVRIAGAFLSAMNDVCITGNPAWFGRCGMDGCLCQPETAEAEGDDCTCDE